MRFRNPLFCLDDPSHNDEEVSLAHVQKIEAMLDRSQSNDLYLKDDDFVYGVFSKEFFSSLSQEQKILFVKAAFAHGARIQERFPIEKKTS